MMKNKFAKCGNMESTILIFKLQICGLWDFFLKPSRFLVIYLKITKFIHFERDCKIK